MQHWSQLGIRNWRAKPGRTAAALGAIALGVGVVIWVTCAYESVRLALRDQVWFWVGRSHVSVESIYGGQGTVFESIVEEARQLDNVDHVTYRLKSRMTLQKVRPDGDTANASDPESALGVQVETIGLVPELENTFREYDQDRVAGRMLAPDDTDGAVIDEALAVQLGLDLGDRFTLQAAALNEGDQPTQEVASFTVVGMLRHRRVAKTQRPVVLTRIDRVQALTGYDREPKRVTRIDLILKDTSPRAISTTERKLTGLVNRYNQGFLVTNAKAKMTQVKAAEDQSAFALQLISLVALFTAFFIILSTLSMGMIERIGQLGTLRCLGATRIQMALLVLSEAIPLGLFGILAGVPVGLMLTQLSVWLAPEYIGHFVISQRGLVLALVGGAITTLAGALLPMLQSLRVSPLAASRPQAQPPPGIFAWLAGAAGVFMIAYHSWMVANVPAPQWILNPWVPIQAVALLYCGYAFIVPATVRVVGLLAMRITAVVLRLHYRLLSDQAGRAVWRSSAICCGLMVGLSLIVTLVVNSESVAAGWDFPKNFCESFVYLVPPVDRKVADEARQIPGVADSAVVNTSIRCTAYGKGLFNFPFSLFVAGEPDDFFRIARLEFVEGNLEDAVTRLRQGGHVLVTPEFVRSKKLGYGDKVYVKSASLIGRGQYFTIAGVVTSPALDIAASYFNAGDMLMSQSVHVVLGTLKDAEQVFHVPQQISLFLVNFDLPVTAPPAEFAEDDPPPWVNPIAFANLVEQWGAQMPERSEEIRQVIDEAAKAAESQSGRPPWSKVPLLQVFRDGLVNEVSPIWSQRTPAQRWQTFREELVMRLIARKCGAGNEMHASVRALKLQIDRDLRRGAGLIVTIPVVALIVAALGVGNLMMANVASRSREIAMLRAIGATRWQITRLVIGEAVVLGLLGCLVGCVLGLHAARTTMHMIEAIWGYRPNPTIPWDWVGLGIGFTLTICLVAGLLPARRAARNNIIDALQTT